ncbi:MAG TPA: hypothetical protein VEL75_06425, partial [Candidatus Methylomirabilis sp.]|nr:hypothetical protein [Candidatus Methylomirabilis sp.]
MTTQRRGVYLAGVALLALAVGSCSTSSTDTSMASAPAMSSATGAVTGSDWSTYHGSYQSWHYSPLTQINTDNVNRMHVAWIHQPGRSTRGLQSVPLVVDGV